jgi:hypothetical protein
MTSREYTTTQLDQPLQLATEAERLTKTIHKVAFARDLVVDITLAWIACYELWQTCRNHAVKHPSPASEHAETVAIQELERLERASATAELILSLAEAAHERLIVGLS